jgi:transposase
MTDVVCQGCQDRDAVIAELRQQLAELRQQIRHLQEQLGRNAANSSLPPSANPPAAPKPVVKTPTGNKPGGQQGHPPRLRLRLPPERLAQVVHHRPQRCDRCQAPLPHDPGPEDPPPTWHQVAELPPLAAVVVEHQGHTRHCPCCGTANRAPIPEEIRAHSVGPRLAAFMAYLRGAHQVSLRGVEEIVETAFDVPMSLGAVSQLEAQTSAALAVPHAEAVAEVRQAPVKNADETSWKWSGKLCWLWLAATGTVAVFVIHGRRGLTGLQALLGETIRGILCSDRWSAYGCVPAERRQVCWSHLKRDFAGLAGRGTAAARWLAEVGLATGGLLFHWWNAYRGGTISRAELIQELEPVRESFREALELGCARRDAKVVALCENLLALEPALWTFLYEEGVEPTNNHAERLLRRGVLWRKRSFGSRSEGGCRFVERLLTAVQTLRLQGRPVLDYLVAAIHAHRNGLPAPSLLLSE